MLKKIVLISLLFVTQGVCDEADWKKLFNGRSFEGWQHLGGKHTLTILNDRIIFIHSSGLNPGANHISHLR